MQKCETKLIYNGLDDSDAFVYDREYPQKDKIVIGFVSRLDDKLGVKAPVKMCDAVSTMNKAFKFVVIGDGLRRSSFVDVFKQRKVEFEMLGNRDDISECLKDLDIFLYPTQADNFPTVVTEAMLSGLPIVAPPIGDIPFMLADGRGYAIEWEEMPDVMKVLSGNHKKRQIVGNRAKQFAMSGFSHETMIKSYEEEYVKIIHDTNKEYYSMSDDNDCLTEPTVSVVVPTYRRPNEAYRCVQYLLKQDLPVEIVVVNDGDCESDYSKVKALPVKYIQLQSNHGLSAARNIGIKAAKGQYIGFCDDDDRWYPSFARRLALELKRKGASVVYGVGFGVRGTQVVDKIDLRMFDEPFDGKELYCRNFIAMPATMIRKSVLVEVGGFDEAMHQNGMSGPEDLELWIRLMLAGHKFVRCAFIGLVYNMGEERFTTTTVNNGAMAKGMRYIADKHKVELGYTDSKGKNFCEVDNDE
jgi:GT2 family glycosyltransferase